MNINWRAVLGLPVLVNFGDGTFGVRKSTLHLGYRYLGTDGNNNPYWWGPNFPEHGHHSRERAEELLLRLYTKKKQPKERALPTNIKVLRAEHLLRKEEAPKSKIDWAAIPRGTKSHTQEEINSYLQNIGKGFVVHYAKEKE